MIKRAVATALGWCAVMVMIPVLVCALWVWEWWGRMRGKTWDGTR
jgi:hypothetical protein